MSTKSIPSEVLQDQIPCAESDPQSRHQDRSTPRRIPSLAHRTLVASAEYEWTTPLNSPGLIVSPCDSSSLKRQAREPECDPLDSEDGDVCSPCQLPGQLVDESGVFVVSQSEHYESPSIDVDVLETN